MGQGVAEVLTFAIGVAISAMAVIAVILMLFSQRAKMNGPVFLCGWALTLAVISTVVYLLADVGNVDTSSEAGKHRRVGLAPTRPERPLSC